MPSTNYRMSEFHAVLGLAQNKYLNSFIERRNEIAKYMTKDYQKLIGYKHHLKMIISNKLIGNIFLRLQMTRDRTTELLRLLDEYEIPTAKHLFTIMSRTRNL